MSSRTRDVRASARKVAVSEEVIVPLRRPRDQVGLASDVRSTLVLGSIQSLRALGYFDRYTSLLDPASRDTILAVVAGVWLPMPIAMAHYQACDALGLTMEQEIALGHEVGNRIQGSFLGLILRTAKGAGVTPWSVLTELDRLWDRTFKGGGGPLTAKIGPKEARVELIGLPLLTVPYFRHAYRGTFLAGLEPFCNKLYIQEAGPIRTKATADVTFRLSWV
jgi:hypothetical protein